MERLSDYDIGNSYEAVVKQTTPITPPDAKDEVRHIVLEIAQPGFDFIVGQSVGVLAPGDAELGEKHHFRLYSVASSTLGDDGKSKTISICVKRCSYIDEVSGERVLGRASNYLCDLKPGDRISMTGPYGHQFTVPKDRTANLLMVGLGTGVAPFRAFVKHIYDTAGGWEGKVRLFYGAQRGVELLYMNDENNDLANYVDDETFKAFEAVSPHPALDEPAALDEALEQHGQEVWEMIQDPNTYVYLAGQPKVVENFDAALAKIAGSEDEWRKAKARLDATGRWAELVY